MNINKNNETDTAGERMLRMVNEEKVHMHIISNSSFVRYGELEHKDTVQYKDFIKTKLCHEILDLGGNMVL